VVSPPPCRARTFGVLHVAPPSVERAQTTSMTFGRSAFDPIR
jgi:hypothetical protein